jgi:hypothetical protein
MKLDKNVLSSSSEEEKISRTVEDAIPFEFSHSNEEGVANALF